MVIETSKSIFEEKVSSLSGEFKFKGDKPTLIKFETQWCGPCKALTPVIEALSEEYINKIDFYKVDVEQEFELAEVFGIQSVPSLLFIPLSGQPKMTLGALSKDKLKTMFNDIFDIR